MLLHSGRSDRGRLSIVVACLLTLCGAGFEPAGAQVPAAPFSPASRHSLTLEAQSVANGGASQLSGSNVGLPFAEPIAIQALSDRRVASNQTNLKVSVRNLNSAPDTVRVEWFFVALPVDAGPSGNREIIFHRDAQALAIPGGKTATQVVTSPEVRAVYERSTTITSAPAGYPYSGGYTSTVSSANTQRGLTIRGWMVRLVAEDGTVLAARGSSQTNEEIAGNPSKLAAMLARSGLAQADAGTARDGASR